MYKLCKTLLKIFKGIHTCFAIYHNANALIVDFKRELVIKDKKHVCLEISFLTYHGIKLFDKNEAITCHRSLKCFM